MVFVMCVLREREILGWAGIFLGGLMRLGRVF